MTEDDCKGLSEETNALVKKWADKLGMTSDDVEHFMLGQLMSSIAHYHTADYVVSLAMRMRTRSMMGDSN